MRADTTRVCPQLDMEQAGIQEFHRPMISGSYETAEVDMSSTVQQSGIKRTDLQRHDLSVPGREVIQNRVDISPEAQFVRHKHPGEEIISGRRRGSLPKSRFAQAAGVAECP